MDDDPVDGEWNLCDDASRENPCVDDGSNDSMNEVHNNNGNKDEVVNDRRPLDGKIPCNDDDDLD